MDDPFEIIPNTIARLDPSEQTRMPINAILCSSSGFLPLPVLDLGLFISSYFVILLFDSLCS